MEKALITVAAVDWSDAATNALRAADKYDTTGGLGSVEGYRETGVLFEVRENDKPVGWYVLEVNAGALGNEGVIACAAGAAGFDLTARVLPVVEKQFKNCRSMVVHTKRRGLVSKMQRQGWKLDGYIMRKSCDAL